MKRFSLIKALLQLMIVMMASVVNGKEATDTTVYSDVLKLLRQDQFESAFYRIEKLKTEYTTRGITRDDIQFLLKVAYILNDKGNYEPSLAYYFYVIELCFLSDEFKYEQAEAYLEVGLVYYFLDLPELSLKYTKNAFAIASANNFRKLVASAISQIGLYHEKTGNYDLALKEFEESLKIRKELGDTHGQSVVLGNMGIVYQKMHQFDDAMKCQLESLALDDSIGNESGVAWSHQMLGSLLFKMNHLDTASAYLAKAESAAVRLNSIELLLQIYKDKKALLEYQGDHKQALKYANLYENLSDSIHNKELMGRVAIMQTESELKEKTREIESQKLTLQLQRYLILGSIIVTLLISSLAILYYRSFKKVKTLNNNISVRNEEIKNQSEKLIKVNASLTKLNLEIAEQKEEIQAQSEELTESNQTIIRINENLENIVKERTAELVQAYKELDTFFYRASHDFRRPLTTFMGLAEVAKITIKDTYALELFEKVRQTANNLDKMLLKLQSISDVGLQHLSYKELTSDDIFNTIYAVYRDEFRSADIAFRTDSTVGTFRSYPSIIKIILENLIENAIFFKGPENPFVKLSIHLENDEVVISVTDNGQGIQEQYQDQIFNMYFRGNENSKGNGLGLYIVKKAAEKLKGRISFTSVHNVGSTFSVFIPKST